MLIYLQRSIANRHLFSTLQNFYFQIHQGIQTGSLKMQKQRHYHLAITCLKLTIEALEQDVKYVKN